MTNFIHVGHQIYLSDMAEASWIQPNSTYCTILAMGVRYYQKVRNLLEWVTNMPNWFCISRVLLLSDISKH